MKDELTFYACDTKVLEEKIMTQDLLMGTELAGELERLGQHLGTLYFDNLYLGDVLKKLEELTGAPFKFLLGMGARRLEPCGPVSYCGRQIPAELGEYVFQIDNLQKLMKKAEPTEKEREMLNKWEAFAEKIHLDSEPGCLDALKKFIGKFRDRTPELISVYTRC
ncbi:MAG: hypothetical protein IJM59_09550 [Proteobacteria bacterium]|jgi:hypothetical protein|nr:hypothetical protein [Pseudomonadota bacterium]